MHRLATSRHFPSAVYNETIDPGSVRLAGFAFGDIPSTVGTPRAKLCFLVRSVSGQISLGVPRSTFHFASGNVRFVHVRAGHVSRTGDRLFARVLIRGKFTFPTDCTSNGPAAHGSCSRKCLILSTGRGLFRLGYAGKHPCIGLVRLPRNILPRCMFVARFHDHQALKCVMSDRRRFCIVGDSKDLIGSTLPNFSPAGSRLAVFKGVFS